MIGGRWTSKEERIKDNLGVFEIFYLVTSWSHSYIGRFIDQDP